MLERNQLASVILRSFCFEYRFRYISYVVSYTAAFLDVIAYVCRLLAIKLRATCCWFDNVGEVSISAGRSSTFIVFSLYLSLSILSSRFLPYPLGCLVWCNSRKPRTLITRVVLGGAMAFIA